MFQILAYVNNSDFTGRVKGMLLYSTIQTEINANFPIGGKSIAIRTLNLDTEWEEISDRLLAIVD